MNLISAPTNDRSAVLRQNSDITVSLRHALQSQRLLSNLTLFLALRFYVAASYLLNLSKTIAPQAIMASKVAFFNTAQISKNAVSALWNSTQMRRLRKKLELEFFTFILGCGNVLCVLMFWPGWWVLALVTFVICYSRAG
jgi:hypothetical protein